MFLALAFPLAALSGTLGGFILAYLKLSRNKRLAAEADAFRAMRAERLACIERTIVMADRMAGSANEFTARHYAGRAVSLRREASYLVSVLEG